MTTPDFQAAVDANRDLQREMLNRFAGDLTWINDPEQIPAAAIGDPADNLGLVDRHYHLGSWVLDRFSEWVVNSQAKLSFAETFEKYELPNNYRVHIRERMLLRPEVIYFPGIQGMADVASAAPLVAARNGIGAEGWGEVAKDSSKFGAAISRDGTEVQFLVRTYLVREPSERDGKLSRRNFLDPSMMKLDDETGITTVTPIPELISIAKNALRQDPEIPEPLAHEVCLALQTKSPTEEAKIMFDATWFAYVAAAERLIYPLFEFEPDEIPAEAPPDPDVKANISASTQKLKDDIERIENTPVWINP